MKKTKITERLEITGIIIKRVVRRLEESSIDALPTKENIPGK
jgi:hypothetical protein